jgi:hypothetical protein
MLYFISIIFLYILGIYFVYKKTNKKLNYLNKKVSPTESTLLMQMIVFYPIFYPEIDIIIKHCESEKSDI